jgi:hypothetical protein
LDFVAEKALLCLTTHRGLNQQPRSYVFCHLVLVLECPEQM